MTRQTAARLTYIQPNVPCTILYPYPRSLSTSDLLPMLITTSLNEQYTLTCDALLLHLFPCLIHSIAKDRECPLSPRALSPTLTHTATTASPPQNTTQNQANAATKDAQGSNEYGVSK